jgi:inner membrane protein
MDSLTQAVLGASVAGAIAPRGQRRKALLAGALLGTLPDLDVFIRYDDAVQNFTYHRSFSHSLFVLVPLSGLLWLGLCRLWAPARAAPARWFAVILLSLITHPLLDAHTAYGTQLFWPLAVSPSMWGTIFIIDPLYTLPLLVGALAAAVRPAGKRAGTTLHAGLLLSTLYLAWTWVGQDIVRQHARAALADLGLRDAPLFVTPTPFNTVLWRVVALTDDGYLEGFDSLLIDEPALRLVAYPSDRSALNAAAGIKSVERLRWFSSDFVAARVDNNRLLIADLRMGQEPTYVFTHVAAARVGTRWSPVPTVRLPVAIADRALADTWRRIWTEPVPASPDR